MAMLHYLIEFQDFLHGTRFDKYKGFTQNYSIFINGEGRGGGEYGFNRFVCI